MFYPRSQEGCAGKGDFLPFLSVPLSKGSEKSWDEVDGVSVECFINVPLNLHPTT